MSLILSPSCKLKSFLVVEMKQKVMLHCFGTDRGGGPSVALEAFLKHSASSYGLIRQVRPAGGINVKLILEFVRQIKKFDPQLIHIRGLGSEGFNAVAAAKLAGVPRVLVSIHGTQRDLVHPRGRLRRWVVVQFLERLTLHLATHVATVSDFAAQRDFLKPYRKKLVGVVPNGVDVPTQTSSFRKFVRSRLEISDDVIVGICVSRVTLEKGYLVLAEALRMLDSKAERLVILIVGGGDESGDIRLAFKKLRRVRVIFVGHTMDVNQYFDASDFFVFPSLHENLSNALLEAMAKGLPVITSDAGGNKEVVEKGGGVLCKTGDPSQFAQAIERFSQEPWILREIGQTAKDNVSVNYSVANMVTGWEQLYGQILQEKMFK